MILELDSSTDRSDLDCVSDGHSLEYLLGKVDQDSSVLTCYDTPSTLGQPCDNLGFVADARQVVKSEVGFFVRVCDGYPGFYVITCPTKCSIAHPGVICDSRHARKHDPNTVWPRSISSASQGGLSDLTGYGHFDQLVGVPEKIGTHS